MKVSDNLTKMEKTLVGLSIKHNGNYQKILKALQEKETILEEEIENMLKNIKSNFTTVVSNDYPNSLKQINCPPFVLFYYGDLNLINNRCVSIDGSKEPSEYGRIVTKTIVSDLLKNEKLSVISGMSEGIETIVQKIVVEQNKKPIIILNEGLDNCYPISNYDIYLNAKNNGLIITEYPQNIKHQNTKKSISKNRLVAGLGEILLIPELQQSSNALITVNFSLDEGKDLYCVPSRITENNYCNYLIQQGAELVINAEDIFRNLY